MNNHSFDTRSQSAIGRIVGQQIQFDYPLFFGLVVLILLGLSVLYSASGENLNVVTRQSIHFGIGFFMMLVTAQFSNDTLRFLSPLVYLFGLLLLIAVMLFGEIGKGAQRWLDIGIVRFQPSELMKIAVPMMIAWYISERAYPPKLLQLIPAMALIVIPGILIARQPDLGTALLVSLAGFFVLFLAGMRWRVMIAATVMVGAALPFLWRSMHDYQRTRVLTLFNPEADPLGAGYHIIQSKIAVGSGGLFGKGWLNGTQSQLDFLPERSTDFIFAVLSEEFGFFGVTALLALFIFIIARGLYIATTAAHIYPRLLAGSMSLTFFVYLLVNIGMVTGIFPVVGVPLPLVSYGGTSIVTLMAAFGIVMSAKTDRRLLSGWNH